MFEILKPLLASKKFQTAVLAVIANLLLRLGIELDVETTLALTSPFLFYVLGQSAVDVKKAGPTVGGAALVLLAAASLSGAAVSMAGCGAAQRVGGDLIDCLAPHTASLAGELTGVVADVVRGATDNTGKVDWSSVKSAVQSFKSDAPKCAFRLALAEALKLRAGIGVQAAGLEWSPDDLRAGYAEINLEVFGARLAPL